MTETKNPIAETLSNAETVEDESFDLYGPNATGPGRAENESRARPASDWYEGGDPGSYDVDWSLVRAAAELDQNDRDNARRLIMWFGEDLAYVSGMGWLTWRGTHWQRDEADLGARLLAQNVVDKIKLEPFFIALDGYKQGVVDRAKGYRELEESERRPLTKTVQVRLCGNSVCPPLAAALVEANCADMAADHRDQEIVA